jgi:hypothetical protein
LKVRVLHDPPNKQTPFAMAMSAQRELFFSRRVAGRHRTRAGKRTAGSFLGFSCNPLFSKMEDSSVGSAGLQDMGRISFRTEGPFWEERVDAMNRVFGW